MLFYCFLKAVFRVSGNQCSSREQNGNTLGSNDKDQNNNHKNNNNNNNNNYYYYYYYYYY